jgi:transcriptional regulator with AAA-type ATPase domain
LAAIGAAGCAKATAAVATGAQGDRAVEVHGWTEREALAALREPEQYEVVQLGLHGDEGWQLVIDPKPELEHRCTLIAIRKLISTALALDRYHRDEQQRTALWPAEALEGEPESVWASEQMSDVLGIARRIAPTALSVLVTGETGTGKEMLARAIHRASDRADKPMLPFNCTAVPRDMIESQLFGYRKGAFTGADASFAGVIRSACGRHPLPRRDRRSSTGGTAQASSFPRDARNPPARRTAADRGRRARDRGNQCQARTAGG